MLNDPQNLAPTKLSELDYKLSSARTRLAQSTEKGGWPFVYAFVATKQHYLIDSLSKNKKTSNDDETKANKFTTAATDGRKYYWHPEFLGKLTLNELVVVFAHETYHIIMQHCNPIRTFGKYPGIWNLAVDYVVNSSIEHDMRINKGNRDNFTTECKNAYKNKTKHPIWNGNFNEPLVLSELIASILELKGLTEEEKEAKKKEKEGKKVVYADFIQYKRSPESIYDEIMNALKAAGESPGDFNDLVGQYSALDDHIDSGIDKKTIFEELLNAATTTRKMCGTIPGCIEDVLKELENPKLKWEDICRQSIQNIRKETGSKNDWSRFRRRNLSLGIYSPKKKDQFVRWLCLLDTSGSMSADDIAYGVSQLKVLDSRSEGIVVPCDAQAYWDKATKIRSMSDLPKINLVGRGGTVFDDFFNDYQRKINGPIDLIIVISDGGFSLNCKKPPVDTVFVITNEHMPSVPWGRVAPLRTFT